MGRWNFSREIKISVGDKIYQFRNHAASRINPVTKKRIGHVHIGSGALETLIGKKEWCVEFSSVDFEVVKLEDLSLEFKN